MADNLPQEALVRVFHFLPLKDRSRISCVSKNWKTASLVDAVSVKLKESHVPHYLHVALPDGAAQLQAAGCPMMSLARSADITWCSAAASGSLLQSMPSLERLAFTSMNSMPLEAVESGLQRLSSLTNLHSLHLSTNEVAPVLEAVPSAPSTLKTLELHLTGDDWQSSVLDQIARQLGSQACRLQALVLRCSHASIYADTQSMESLSQLLALTSLRMGPNPDDQTRQRSPLGFARLPSFVAALSGLQHLDITMADSPTSASLSTLDLTPIQHLPNVKLVLRADTSIRAVTSLPSSLAQVTGLQELIVQGFAFEDLGGWCTKALFDVSPLVQIKNLKELSLQLLTWECEHCDCFEVCNLGSLTQLHSLDICVASPIHSRVASRCSSSTGCEGPEVLLLLPALKSSKKVTVSSSMRVVLRNSKVLARSEAPGVLAESIMLEEPLPQRPGHMAGSSTTAPSKPVSDSAQANDTHTHPRDQCRVQAHPTEAAQTMPDRQGVEHFVRAPAYAVISALPKLWPNMQVWQYQEVLPAVNGQITFDAELCCHSTSRNSMKAGLNRVLIAAAASMVD